MTQATNADIRELRDLILGLHKKIDAIIDSLDLAEGQAAIAQSKANGELPQPWDEVKAELGL